MPLEIYRKKRDFKHTPEPKGKLGKPKDRRLSFVVQKHAASRLHYDFRLELNGVLLSWAVPKGPSLDPNDKRLAMHVEDHPIEYGEFEGIIPPKQYGAGTVMLWDRGSWLPKDDPVAGYKKGKFKFELRGEKLHGGWTLVKSHGGKYGDNAWLLFKEEDEYARVGRDARVVDDQPDSVTTHRSLKQIAADPKRVWHSNKSVAENIKNGSRKKTRVRINLAKIAGARKAPVPDFVDPQLAKSTDTTPTSDRWIHEVKYDGYRMLGRVDGKEVRITSRNHRDWTREFPLIAGELGDLPAIKNAWFDGEIVVLDAQGRSSFQALQNSLSTKTTDEALFFVFDLPYLNGYDLRRVVLEKRKDLLKSLIPTGSVIRYSEDFDVSGPKFFSQVCSLGLEGMISKVRTSTYTSARTDAWLKIKCSKQQEFVVGGFTNPEGSRHGFGALLVGVYDSAGKLRYAGKVGTGFNQAHLSQIRKTLNPLVQDRPPFINPPKGAEGRRAHWVEPTLVAQVTFTEWTSDGILRHASFLGLRKDKNAPDVVREDTAVARRSSHKPDSRTSLRNKAKISAEIAHDTVAGVKLTNPDKVLYPEAGVTKRDLALYYQAIADWIIPHLSKRPLTLLRCPNGWNKECFYQKHADQSVAEIIERVSIQDSGGAATYMMANSTGALVALTQMGVLELHPWGSRAPKLALPDRIIFDFDPDESLEWKQIAEAGNLLKTLLDTLGLRGFLKTTGGKGLHVVIPIEAKLPWEPIKGFSQAIAQLFVKTFPDRFTSKLLKISRRGKIFIDYLRNDQGATAVAPYSIRAKANAPVSTPIAWTELARDVRYDYFNVKNVPSRMKRLKRDPWHDFLSIRQTVTKAMMTAVGYAPQRDSRA